VLALKYGCAVLIGVLVRKPGGRFLALNDGPLEFERSGDDERDVVALTQKITSRLEEYIRAYPDQWLWTHRRWGK
jgi:KDO2-lipid IV(A) lauroyltransferase